MTTTRPSQPVRAAALLGFALAALVRPSAPAAQGLPTEVLAFPAIADTYVDASAPTTNYDPSVTLRADASPVRIIYLRFAVSGIGGRPVLQARLRLRATGPATESGGTVHVIQSHGWDPATVTYATRPPVDGPGLATLGPVAAGTVVDFDLGGAVAADGVYDLAVDNRSTDSAGYASSAAAGGSAPTLLLNVAAPPAPVVRILQPEDGVTFFEGDLVTLQGSALDVADGDLGATLAWTSSLEGPLGTGATVTAPLGRGEHTIGATARDRDGLEGRAEIRIAVVSRPAANTPPLVTILAPRDGQTVIAGEPIAFDGRASDLEDGSVGSRLAWTSDRDGALGTGETFTRALGAGVHRITTRATDAGGLVGTAVATITVTPPRTLEVLPVADAYADAGAPTTTFGTSSLLRVDADVARVTYLRFVVDGVGRQLIGRAVLRLQVDAGSGAGSNTGGTVRALGTHAWQEPTLTWGNRPAVTGTALATAGAVAAGQVVELDVTALVQGDGVYDLALTSTSADGVEYRARESATPPRLVLTLTGHPPEVTITAPPTGLVLFAGEPLSLVATATDVEDGDLGPSIAWQSSLDGPLGSGPTLGALRLGAGTHAITAAVTDTDGRRGQAQITVRVRPPNTPPAITITAPPDGAAVPVGTQVTLTATVSDDFDLDPGTTLTWRSSRDGALGGGPVRRVVLAEGEHRLTATATDGDGATATATVTLIVTPTPPAVAITAPTRPLLVVFVGTPVTFAATATDTTDGDLSAALAWRSDLAGPLGAGPTVSAPDLGVGVHTITAGVTDAGGLSGTATCTVVVRPPNEPPALTITAPANGAVVLAGAPFVLGAVAVDAEDGDLGPLVAWSSNREGAFGTGAMLHLPALSAGTHVLTARVVDRDGAGASATATVIARPATVTVTAAADTYVDKALPTRAFGSATGLFARGSTAQQILLRFTVSGVSPLVVERATLQLTAGTASADGSNVGGTVHALTNTTWSESTTTWNTRPAVDGPALDTEGKVAPNALVELGVTAALRGDGTYAFALVSSASDSVKYQSRETGKGPRLFLTLRNPDEPRVAIAAPLASTKLRTGVPASFLGTAVDPQDGDLSSALDWTSSVDGFLGTGRAFTRMLSPGTHEITASAADAQGLVARATVTVEVDTGGANHGFRDFKFPGNLQASDGTRATASKPESKLWFADGRWWGVLFRTGRGHTIHYLDRQSETWVDTGVLVDERGQARQDVLWTGTKLYAASRFTSTGTQNRLLRFSYDAATTTWTRDPGFPVALPGGGTESLTIARDSTGTLWIAYTLGKKVIVNRSLGDDTRWGAPFTVPVGAVTAVDTDDIAGVVALPGRIGVFWSNQLTKTFYLAVHVDGTSTTDAKAWNLEVAASGNKVADDHFNLKVADDGRLFVAVKTSRSSGDQTGIGLLIRSPAGQWSPLHRVITPDTLATRPVCLLDETRRKVHVFYSAFHASIYYKTSDMDTIAFPPGLGTPFIASETVTDINNPTSTKQHITPESGIEILASSRGDLTYWHAGFMP